MSAPPGDATSEAKSGAPSAERVQGVVGGAARLHREDLREVVADREEAVVVRGGGAALPAQAKQAGPRLLEMDGVGSFPSADNHPPPQVAARCSVWKSRKGIRNFTKPTGKIGLVRDAEVLSVQLGLPAHPVVEIWGQALELGADASGRVSMRRNVLLPETPPFPPLAEVGDDHRVLVADVHRVALCRGVGAEVVVQAGTAGIMGDEQQDAGSNSKLSAKLSRKGRPGAKVPVREPVHFGEHGEGGPVQHEEVHEVTRQGANGFACRAFAAQEVVDAEVELPETHGTVPKLAGLAVEDDAHHVQRVGGGHQVLEDETATSERVQHEVIVALAVLEVVEDGVRVVDVGGQ